jgi:hypothetical protein
MGRSEESWKRIGTIVRLLWRRLKIVSNILVSQYSMQKLKKEFNN